MDERRAMLAQLHSALRAYADLRRQEEESIRRRVRVEEEEREQIRQERSRATGRAIAIWLAIFVLLRYAYEFFKSGQYLYAALCLLGMAAIHVAVNRQTNQ